MPLGVSIIALASFLAGIALGLRFKVLILIPTIAGVLALASGIGIVHHNGFWTILLSGGLAVTSLQIGYLTGAGFRHGLGADRFSGLLSTLFGGSHTPGRSVS
jgi:hypothetical protein